MTWAEIFRKGAERMYEKYAGNACSATVCKVLYSRKTCREASRRLPLGPARVKCRVQGMSRTMSNSEWSRTDIFHALGLFIFKRQFWQNMMVLDTSEHWAWLSHAIMCYMTGDFFDETIWTPWKSTNTHWDLGSRVPQYLQDLGHFYRNFGLVKDRTESDVKVGYECHKLQQK